MSETPGRLLRMLSLLQTPREWPGPELAQRLGVSTRTVRNDIERLRGLGYPVEATRGPVGGYRLSAGTAMPPLLLEDEEAVAVALSLRTAAGGAVPGVEETALRALTKLQQVLPDRLARRVDAVQSYTLRTGARTAAVDAGALGVMAAAARDRERLRFAYSDHTGTATERRVEPYRLVNAGRRWYLVAWDAERTDWRVFRVDRITDVRGIGHRFTLRDLPAEDVAGWVSARTRAVQLRFRATVVVHAPSAEVAARMGGWHDGSIEALEENRCRLDMGARSAVDLAKWLGFLDTDFEIVDSAELTAAVEALGRRYLRACG